MVQDIPNTYVAPFTVYGGSETKQFTTVKEAWHYANTSLTQGIDSMFECRDANFDHVFTVEV